MKDIEGELHGVKYIISRAAAEKLALKNIDAVAELETAIEVHHEIVSKNTPQEK